VSDVTSRGTLRADASASYRVVICVLAQVRAEGSGSHELCLAWTMSCRWGSLSEREWEGSARGLLRCCTPQWGASRAQYELIREERRERL
jgi:hypothetical protein